MDAGESRAFVIIKVNFMWGKIFEQVAKGIATAGVKEYQKHQLNKEAEKHGDILASIDCTITESGIVGWQGGRLVITKDAMLFSQLGKTTQIGFKLSLSWRKTFLIRGLEYILTDDPVLFGAITYKLITFMDDGTTYRIRIKESDGDTFIKAIADAKCNP
ncbi:hypothetical protein FFJ24_001040 [Pedobacter sp. KBS0701]|uniref:hypothetical protein n=1 Tax=Pedobacter sp. KBS0701 TaxID=2578106 RepID=UPI00110EE6CA|nr:hypothetical protein [Pedobacter sp. KBS0701]QDW23487.1 hypothetical protein FFJ24_001040 [Pedobacter sp. KBS0701]